MVTINHVLVLEKNMTTGTTEECSCNEIINAITVYNTACRDEITKVFVLAHAECKQSIYHTCIHVNAGMYTGLQQL